MSKKKVAILQSNYIPWKGYFDLINMVDEFIIYDEMQYTRRDWRNRNRIKTPNGTTWLTIPVEVKGKFHQKINETKISENGWNRKHWDTIRLAYSKTDYFKKYKDFFEDLYITQLDDKEGLSDINLILIRKLNELLNINTTILLDKDIGTIEGKTERLLDLCKKRNANVYLSGPAAKDYLDESLFLKENIQVEWMDYSGYPQYNQLHPPFEHGVSVLDLLFNTGDDFPKFMKSFH